jgi:hypothetical protein
MPIIHVRVSYKSVILKDWEGLPVEKETKIKDFFGDISILYLSPDWWDAEFEVKFSPSKTLVGEKFQHNALLGKLHFNMEFMHIFISYRRKRWGFLIGFLILLMLLIF